MDDCEWMYTGRWGYGQWIDDWMNKTNDFLETVFRKAGTDKVWCPCSECENKKHQTKVTMGKHLYKYGFMPGYTRWICHGEAGRRRDEVVRQRLDELDGDGGVPDMLDDFHEAHFGEGRMEVEEESEATAKAYYDILSAAQQQVHGHTKVSQLDAIGRVIAFKA